MEFSESANEAQTARWREVLGHTIEIGRVEEDQLDAGFLVLYLDPRDADTWGIYEVLSISPEGTIAEYNVNQPFHYQTFAELLTAAAVRTAAS